MSFKGPKGNSRSKYLARALLLVVIIAAGVWLLQRLASPTQGIRQVILISIDTCRADYLSCYGYSRQTTPNIDAIAAEGILFENTISPVPLTLPAHSSMLTGTIPPYHGVHTNPDYQLSKSNLTLAELLKENGFRTAAIISAFVLDSQFGISQGFDTYNDRFEEAHRGVGPLQRKGGESTRFAVEWLEQQKEEKSFLFLHYFDPHSDYVPPEPFASRFVDNPYAGEVAYTDQCIGQVLRKLKKLGLYDSSLIIITADHGEMLGEHGEQDHGYFIYQSAIKVPLIFKPPGSRKSQRISDLVGIVDIMPTICSMLEIEVPGQVQGQDLSPYFSQKKPAAADRQIYCETMEPLSFDANSLQGVVSSRFKYIQTTRPELYDLIEDPTESNNLVELYPQRARIMKDALAELLEQSARENAMDSKLGLGEHDLRRLESLGYVGGSTTEQLIFDQSKKDPKDLLGVVMCIKDAMILFQQNKNDQAILAYDKAIELRPKFALSYHNRGIAYSGMGEVDKAIADYTQAIRLKPKYDKAYYNRGSAYLRKGNNEQAIRDLSKILELNPKVPEAYSNRGIAYYRKGDHDRAIRDFSEAIRLNPSFVPAYQNRGLAYRSKGDNERATQDLDMATRLKRRNPRVQND